jgi:flagellar biosynthesis protein FlhF
MKIKRFFAPDMRQAIKQVRETFGPDAVILSNKSVDGGVELVAARDYDENALASLPEPAVENPSTGWNNPASQTLEVEADEPPGQVASLARRLREQAQARNPMAGPPRRRPANQDRGGAAVAEEEAVLAEMRREMAALRRMMETELSELSWHNMERQNPRRKELLRRLLELDLHPELCRVLADEVDNADEPEGAFRSALTNLARRLPESDTDFLEQGGAVALVGPTGVGKTTTVAKLAARFCLRYGNRQLALITTDNFRIGAEEQLHTYGRILDVPVRTVNDEQSLNAALNLFSERRLVLIDTAGMSQRDVRLGQQIGLLKRGNRPIHTLLTLAATTQEAALEHAIEAFAPARPSACVVTKIDEACSLGGLISTLSRHRLAMAFSADGQKVPEDIHVGRPYTLVSRAVELARRAGGVEIGDDLLAMKMGGSREHAHV